MDDPLRRHWTSLVKTLTPSITRDLAHKAFERRHIAQSELHDILAPQDHRVTTNLLLVMGKRSRGALLEFARDLSNINLKDASIQNVGRRLLRDLECSAPPTFDDRQSITASLSEAAGYQRRMAAGESLEFNTGIRRWSWTTFPQTLPDNFTNGRTTATFVHDRVLLARYQCATIHLINTFPESDNFHILPQTSVERPWAITQLFRMNNKCYALVKTANGDEIVYYDVAYSGATRVNSITTVPNSDKNRISDMSVVASDPYIYIIGGIVANSFYTTSEIWEYNTRNKQWNILPPMPTSKALASCVMHKNKLIIGGGYLEIEVGNMSNAVEALDLSISKPKWTSYPPTTMAGCQLVSLAGNLLAIGGKSPDLDKTGSNHVEMLDEKLKTFEWAPLPSMNGHRIGHAVCDTPSMKVIAVGGLGNKTFEELEYKDH